MALKGDQLEKGVSVVSHWQQNPHDFVLQVFGVEPDLWQVQLMEDLAVHDRIAVRSGHGVGKSAALSWTIFWWLMTRYPARVACTAPTSHQLSDILWGELAKWHERMTPAFAGLYEIKQDSLVLKSKPKNCSALARTARKEQPEAFQGQHSDHMLFIVDEASGVDDIIFEVGAGALSTAGAKLIMVGNPTRTSGYFYDAFHKMREEWCTHKVSCMDAKMVDQEFPKRMARQYGEDSNIYRVRVLGEFPTSEDSAVIPIGWLESAVNREIEEDPLADDVWGVDVARFGDDESALVKRTGRIVHEIKTWKHKDIMQTTGIIHNEWIKTPVSKRPAVINVDSIGLGAGVVDRLKELGLPVRGINVAELPSSNDQKFMRLRDELWWKGREWFMERECRILEDQRLVGELSGPTYDYTSSGKIQVESKSEMKKRGIPSPNVADAFLLTLAKSGTRRHHFRKPLNYSNRRVV